MVLCYPTRDTSPIIIHIPMETNENAFLRNEIPVITADCGRLHPPDSSCLELAASCQLASKERLNRVFCHAFCHTCAPLVRGRTLLT